MKNITFSLVGFLGIIYRGCGVNYCWPASSGGGGGGGVTHAVSS